MGWNLKSLIFVMICMAWHWPLPAYAEGPWRGGKTVGTFHGESPALNNLRPKTKGDVRQTPRIIPLRHPRSTATKLKFDSETEQPFIDEALQNGFWGIAVPAPKGLNILGLGDGFPNFTICCAPPDTNAAVGTTQILETVNLSLAVFSKTTGDILSGPTDFSELFNGVGNNCENGELSDPVVLFDKVNQRWVITFFAATPGGPIGLSQPFLQCFAVSKSSDATGTYFLYSFDLTFLGGANGALNDYGKLGIWADAYYFSANEFDAVTGDFLGASPCAFQTSAMIAGGAPQFICFSPIATEDSLLPADADGAMLPASGEPEFFVGTLDGATHFNLWTFHVDFATPANSTFVGPVVLTTKKYKIPCGGGGACIRQPRDGELLDSLGDRLMFRAAYRNFGDHESIVVSHTVATARATGVRWYEIRTPASSPSIFQQGTFAPDMNFRWMPSIAMDKVGDIAVGYSVSGRRLRPSIRYTGRKPSQARGKMSSEATIVTGTGVQTDTSNRWGDYSSMSIDPSDDCTFWYAQEYIQESGSFLWSTRLASFKFPKCL